jgi:hypothetical protein
MHSPGCRSGLAALSSRGMRSVAGLGGGHAPLAAGAKVLVFAEGPEGYVVAAALITVSHRTSALAHLAVVARGSDSCVPTDGVQPWSLAGDAAIHVDGVDANIATQRGPGRVRSGQVTTTAFRVPAYGAGVRVRTSRRRQETSPLRALDVAGSRTSKR